MAINSVKHGKRTIKVGSTYPYASRENTGRARVEAIELKRTGHWITLFDKARNKAVTVRPSQVGVAP